VINLSRGGLGASELIAWLAAEDLQALVRGAVLVIVQVVSARSGTLPGEERLRMVADEWGRLEDPFKRVPWFQSDASPPLRVEAHLQQLMANDIGRFEKSAKIMQKNWITQMQQLGGLLQDFKRPAFLIYLSSRRAPDGLSDDPLTVPHLVTQPMIDQVASAFTRFADPLEADYDSFAAGETFQINVSRCGCNADDLKKSGGCYYTDVRRWTQGGHLGRVCGCDFVWRPINTYPSTEMQVRVGDRLAPLVIELFA